jgi:hypothetical protein
MQDITKHGDFKRYYCNLNKNNYYVLGYFGGGSLNVVDTYNAAKVYAEELNIPLEKVQIDEIFVSNRFKGFKVLFAL